MTTFLEILLSNAVCATAVALVVFIVTRRSLRPQVVYWLWMLVLLKLVTPPLIDVPIATSQAPATERLWFVTESGAPLPVAEAVPAVVSSTVAENTTTVAAGSPTWPTTTTVLGSLWCIGLAAWLLVALRRTLAFRRHLRQAPLAPEEIRRRAHRIARDFGLAAAPVVRLGPGTLPPLLWAMGRSHTILLPRQLLERLTEEQLETLLAHEIAHLRRRDHWVRRFEMIIVALYWWFPVAWWARRQMQDAEEQCCDAWVLWRFPRLARAYAQTLLTTVDFLSEPEETWTRPALPPAASGFGKVGLLKRRFRMILRQKPDSGVPWASRLLVVLAAAVVLPLAPFAVQADGDVNERIIIVKADGSKEEYVLSSEACDDVRSAIRKIIAKRKGGSLLKREIDMTVDGSDAKRGIDLTVDRTTGGNAEVDVRIEGNDDLTAKIREALKGKVSDGWKSLGGNVDVDGARGHVIIKTDDGRHEVINIGGDGKGKGGEKRRRLRIVGPDGEIKEMELSGEGVHEIDLGGKGKSKIRILADGEIKDLHEYLGGGKGRIEIHDGTGGGKHDIRLRGEGGDDVHRIIRRLHGGHGKGDAKVEIHGEAIVVDSDGKTHEIRIGGDGADVHRIVQRLHGAHGKGDAKVEIQGKAIVIDSDGKTHEIRLEGDGGDDVHRIIQRIHGDGGDHDVHGIIEHLRGGDGGHDIHRIIERIHGDDGGHDIHRIIKRIHGSGDDSGDKKRIRARAIIIDDEGKKHEVEFEGDDAQEQIHRWMKKRQAEGGNMSHSVEIQAEAIEDKFEGNGWKWRSSRVGDDGKVVEVETDLHEHFDKLLDKAVNKDFFREDEELHQRVRERVRKALYEKLHEILKDARKEAKGPSGTKDAVL